MAETVQIIIEAKDVASGVLRGIAQNFGSLGDSVISLNSLSSANSGLMRAQAEALFAVNNKSSDAGEKIKALAKAEDEAAVASARASQALSGLALEGLKLAIDFGKESVDAFMKGAQAAKQLSMVSGDSIENASRFIQVLDDYQLGMEDALAATRALTKQGLEPNLATLAKLSDQYRAIQDPQEKNEFIMKNLGRAGLQWAKVLDQGSEALLAQADAIDTNLIFTDKMYEASEKLRLQQDQLNDNWEAMKVRVGGELVPVLSNFVDGLNMAAEAQDLMRERGQSVMVGSALYAQTLEEVRKNHEKAAAATKESTKVTEVFGQAAEKTKEELKAEEEAIKAITKANEEYLSLVGNLADELTDYEQKHNDIQAELNDGKITLDQAKQKWTELADAQELATRRMILNMLQEQLSAGGLNQAETAFLLDTGLKWGVYSQSAVNAARDAQRQVQQLTNQFNSLPTSHTFTTYFQTVGALPGFNPQAAPGGYGYQGNRRAGGGSVSAGMMYQVNETRTEYFQPSMNGTVIPLGGNGGNGNGVVINYSPMISLGNQREVETVLLPMVEQAVRKMQADGRAAL